MSHDGAELSHTLSGGILRSGCGSAVRFSPAGSMACGVDEVVGEPNRDDGSGFEPAEFNRLAAEVSRMIPLWPRDLETATRGGRARLLAKIRMALRAEHARGRAGHWAYDYARHDAMIRNFRKMRKLAKC